MDQFSGGNWTMIPNVQGHGSYGTPTNQDHLFLQQQQQQLQQQQQFHHQQQPQQFQPQDLQFQQFQQQHYSQQQFHQQQQQQRMLHSPPPPMQSPPQQPPVQQQQSLASHFHLFPLVEKLAEAIETGTRDQNSDALVTELNGLFEKCQQLLNSISGSLSSKRMTVDGQKQKLKEGQQLLDQRRELIATYRKSVEDLVNVEP